MPNMFDCIIKTTRKLPAVRGAGRLCDFIIKRIPERHKPAVVSVEAYGYRLELDPRECVDAKLIFAPQIYDRNERKILERHLAPGDVFLDIGSNIGIYSLIASGQVGPTGKVFAFEADPYNFSKLQKNIALNTLENITPLNIGISDRNEHAELILNTTGNRGGNSFARTAQAADSPKESVHIACKPLQEILKDVSCGKVKGIKIDIEGYEYRVLSKYFEDTPNHDLPEFIIFEHIANMSEGDTPALIAQQGYSIGKLKGYNYLALKH